MGQPKERLVEVEVTLRASLRQITRMIKQEMESFPRVVDRAVTKFFPQLASRAGKNLECCYCNVMFGLVCFNSDG